MHRKSAHERELNNNQANVARTHYKWSKDNLRLIAGKEIELGDDVKYINVKLAKYNFLAGLIPR